MSSINKKTQLLFIFLTVFIYLLGFGIIIPILPILSRDFGATATQTGLLMSAYSLMQFLFAPFWGRLSDQFGRKPVLLFCLLGESTSYILFALSRDWNLLLVSRILAGLFGGSISTASAFISDITPPQERSKGMALIGAAFGLGFVLGPAIGGFLTHWGTKISSDPLFPTSFAAYFVCGICLFTFLFGFIVLKESLTEKSKAHDGKNRFLVLLEKFKVPIVSQLITVYFLVSFAMSAMEATLILFMGEKFHWGITQVSYGFGYIGVIMILTQGYIVRKVMPIFGERKVLLLGLINFFTGLFLIAFSSSVEMMAISMTFLALGNGLTNPSILGSISLLTNTTEQGSTLGATQSLSSLGRILGPAIGGVIYHRISIYGPFLFSSLLSLMGLAIYLKVKTEIPEHGKKTSIS